MAIVSKSDTPMQSTDRSSSFSPPGNTSEHSFAIDSEYRFHYKNNANGLLAEQYGKNLKTIPNLKDNNDEQQLTLDHAVVRSTGGRADA